jgi:hypothetical protein
MVGLPKVSGKVKVAHIRSAEVDIERKTKNDNCSMFSALSNGRFPLQKIA